MGASSFKPQRLPKAVIVRWFCLRGPSGHACLMSIRSGWSDCVPGRHVAAAGVLQRILMLEDSLRIVRFLADQVSLNRRNRPPPLRSKAEANRFTKLYMLQGLPGVGPSLAHGSASLWIRRKSRHRESIGTDSRARSVGPRKAARIRIGGRRLNQSPDSRTPLRSIGGRRRLRGAGSALIGGGDRAGCGSTLAGTGDAGTRQVWVRWSHWPTENTKGPCRGGDSDSARATR